MDCSHVPWNSAPSADWNFTEEWKSAADAAWGNQEGGEESPTDVDYASSKGKGTGEGKSMSTTGKGKQQNSAQYCMMMAMKAMKVGGKSSSYSGPPGAGFKGGGKGKGKSDDRECYNCGAKGHIARNCPHPKATGNSRVPVREAAHDEGAELVWGALVIDEVQDMDSAESERRRKSELEANKRTQGGSGVRPQSKLATDTLKDKPWRKKIQGGHRLKFVLDSGAVKTIVPKDAIPGMKLDRSKGGSFRVANGDVIPNLGSTKLKGSGAIGGSPLQIGTQVAEVTKPLASVDEMVASGMMVIMHRSGGIAKRLDADSERRIRDIVKQVSGSEIVLERSGGSFTFEIDVKSEEEDWSNPKRPAKGGNRKMDVDEMQVEKSYYDALWDEECEEVECTPCGATFHRH